MKTLFCPKCGDALSPRADGTLKCVRGQMQLSVELARRLTDCYVSEVRRPREPDLAQFRGSGGIGGRWFCPGDGTPAVEREPWNLRCPVCSRSLFEFVRSLIELHPHFDPGTSTWI